MKPLDRIRAALARQPLDRLPVGPYVANWTAWHAGLPLSTYCTDGRQMADAHLAAWEQIGYDVIFPDADNYYLAEGFGCRSNLYEDNFATLAKPALEDPQQAFGLDVPDPQRDGRMPVYLEATRRIAQRVGDRAVVRVPGTGPFAVAAYLIGVEAFLLEIATIESGSDSKNAGAVEYMLDLAGEALIRFGLAQLAAGAQILQCGDSLASGSVISPRTYQRFVLPRHRRIFAAWKEAGAITALHICGDNRRMLELFATTGADIVAIDTLVDLTWAKRAIGDRAGLIGNVDPVGVMLEGSAAAVEAAARQCIAAASAGGGYILGTGCEVPPGAPVENLRAFVRAAHEPRAA
ncbi:MAG TPA: uroporphyrinogen decarboxylase family protein [Anaerolineales bacterium]|nr:uroporphyrinogen decarboxylase family protein [Anaerolineales bacterium]